MPSANQETERFVTLLVTSKERQMISEMLYAVERAFYRSQKKVIIPLGEKFSEITLENVTKLKERLNAITKPLTEEIAKL